MSNPVSLQESPERKAEWLLDAEARMPVGTRVKIISSDLDDDVGALGSVIGYDVGHDGEWPVIRVRFDKLTGGRVQDSFYCDGCCDDEIVKIGTL